MIKTPIKRSKFDLLCEAINEERTHDVIESISRDPSLLKEEKLDTNLYTNLNLLDLAALKGNVILVKALAKQGLPVNRKIIQQLSSQEVLNALKEVKYKLNGSFPKLWVNRQFGMSDIESAMTSGIRAVQFLIQHDPNYLTNEKTLDAAILFGTSEIIKFLLEEGVFLNVKTVLPSFALYANRLCSSLEELQSLLQLLLSFGAGNDRNINAHALNNVLKNCGQKYLDEERKIRVVR